MAVRFLPNLVLFNIRITLTVGPTAKKKVVVFFGESYIFFYFSIFHVLSVIFEGKVKED